MRTTSAPDIRSRAAATTPVASVSRAMPPKDVNQPAFTL